MRTRYIIFSTLVLLIVLIASAAVYAKGPTIYLPLVLQTGSQAGCPQTGSWSGTTNQMRPIWFIVEDSPRCQIAPDTLRIQLQDSCYNLIDLHFEPSYAITNNKFGTPSNVQGEFSSSSQAYGTYEYEGFNDQPPFEKCTASGNWTAAPGGHGSDEPVYVLVVQPDGKILLGGQFTTLAGQPRERIARLNADGSLDTAFNPGANGWVSAIAVQADGKILVGGDFTELNGQPRDRIGRLKPDGTLDTSFNPGADGWVRALAVQDDGKSLLGGSFTEAGGQPRLRIARLNPGGSLDTTFNPGANNTVWALAVQVDNKIVVGGDFSELDGQKRNNIGRLKSDGTLDTAFNPGPTVKGQVLELVLQTDDKILVGGRFDTLGGQSRKNIGRVKSDGTLDTSFNPGADNTVYTMLVQADDKIVVGGFFHELGGKSRDFIGRLNPGGTLDTAFNPGANLAVRALVVQLDSKIVAGGEFTKLGGQPRSYIARLNPDGTVDVPIP